MIIDPSLNRNKIFSQSQVFFMFPKTPLTLIDMVHVHFVQSAEAVLSMLSQNTMLFTVEAC